MSPYGPRAALTSLLCVAVVVVSVPASLVAGTWLPLGLAIGMTTPLALSSLLDAAVHTFHVRTRANVAWLAMTSLFGGAVALLGLGYAALLAVVAFW